MKSENLSMHRLLTLIVAVAVIFAFTACNWEEKRDKAQPNTLEAKKELLLSKKEELRKLSQEINTLEDSITSIDPSFGSAAAVVSYDEVELQSFTNYVSVQATVRAKETAMASAEIPGRISRLNVKEGDRVRRGQLIAVLDVENITTQRAELETAMSLAKTVYERQKRLWDQNIGSEIQYLEAKNNYERLQDQLKSVDVQANKRNVYAPISGTVENVMLRAGENAMPGAPIVAILSTDDLVVVADASEELLSKVNRRDMVNVAVPALNMEFEARVTRIGKTVDPANRTFEVEIDVPSKYTSKLKANLLAEVEILDYEAKDIITVSQDDIQREIDGRSFIFVAREENGKTVAKKIFIEIGDTYDNTAVVTKGLSEGDRIITTGARTLVNEQIITLSQNPITNG